MDSMPFFTVIKCWMAVFTKGVQTNVLKPGFNGSDNHKAEITQRTIQSGDALLSEIEFIL